MVLEAAVSVARELALEALAEKAGIDVSDDDVKAYIREEAAASGEDGRRGRHRGRLGARPAGVDPRGSPPPRRARPPRRRRQADRARARGGARQALDTRQGKAGRGDEVVDPRQQGDVNEPPDSDGDRADLARRALVRHLLAPAQRAHHLPRHADRRPDREPHRRAAAPSRVRGPRQGHLDLRQLAGRRRVRGARDLRHDAVHQARRADDLRRHGDVHGRRRPRRGNEGKAQRAAALEDPHPPGLGRLLGPADRHRDLRAGGNQHQAANGRDHVQGHRAAGREDRQGHGPRLLHDGRRGEGLRDHRPGHRAPRSCTRSGSAPSIDRCKYRSKRRHGWLGRARATSSCFAASAGKVSGRSRN